MDKANPIVSKLHAVTLNWASPVTLDEAKNKGRQTSVLLKSTPEVVAAQQHGHLRRTCRSTRDLGFPVEGEQASRPLAVSVRGTFDSFFKGKPSPLLQPDRRLRRRRVSRRPTPRAADERHHRKLARHGPAGRRSAAATS